MMATTTPRGDEATRSQHGCSQSVPVSMSTDAAASSDAVNFAVPSQDEQPVILSDPFAECFSQEPIVLDELD